MDLTYFVMLVARWLHILSASLAIGVPIFMHFVLIPARAKLDESQRVLLHDEVIKRWRMFVHLMIVVFLATGFWTFLGVARWKVGFSAEMKFWYHMMFGVKVVLALVMFFISSALAGRSAGLAGMRANAKFWVGVLVVLAVVVVGLSGVLRFMPTYPIS